MSISLKRRTSITLPPPPLLHLYPNNHAPDVFLSFHFLYLKITDNTQLCTGKTYNKLYRHQQSLHPLLGPLRPPSPICPSVTLLIYYYRLGFPLSLYIVIYVIGSYMNSTTILSIFIYNI